MRREPIDLEARIGVVLFWLQLAAWAVIFLLR